MRDVKLFENSFKNVLTFFDVCVIIFRPAGRLGKLPSHQAQTKRADKPPPLFFLADVGLKSNPLALADAIHCIFVVPESGGPSGGAIGDVDDVHCGTFLLTSLDDYIIHCV